METKETINFKGKVKITKRKVSGLGKVFEKLGLLSLAKRFSKVVSIREYNNLFLNAGRYSILDRMTGLDKGEITYLAIGDGTTEPALTDTQLVNETFRKALTTKTREDFYFKSSTYLATTEANGNIFELALYGDDATITANSGTIYTRVKINESKTSGESLTIDYNIQFLTT